MYKILMFTPLPKNCEAYRKKAGLFERFKWGNDHWEYHIKYEHKESDIANSKARELSEEMGKQALICVCIIDCCLPIAYFKAGRQIWTKDDKAINPTIPCNKTVD